MNELITISIHHQEGGWYNFRIKREDLARAVKIFPLFRDIIAENEINILSALEREGFWHSWEAEGQFVEGEDF